MAVSCPVCVPKASVLISPANLVWPVRSGQFPRLSGSPQVVARSVRRLSITLVLLVSPLLLCPTATGTSKSRGEERSFSPPPPPSSPTAPRDALSWLYQMSGVTSEPRSCVKVEVAVLGSPSLISLMVSVDVKQHWT